MRKLRLRPLCRKPSTDANEEERKSCARNSDRNMLVYKYHTRKMEASLWAADRCEEGGTQSIAEKKMSTCAKYIDVDKNIAKEEIRPTKSA